MLKNQLSQRIFYGLSLQMLNHSFPVLPPSSITVKSHTPVEYKQWWVEIFGQEIKEAIWPTPRDVFLERYGVPAALSGGILECHNLQHLPISLGKPSDGLSRMPDTFTARLFLPQYLAMYQEKRNSENIFPTILNTLKEIVKYS